MLKNRFSLLCLAVASSLTLTACDVVDAAYDETLNDNAPEIVIAGGFKIDIQGNAVPVEGYDNCSLNTLQGSVDTDKSNCIVLDRTRKKVPVLVHLSSGPVKEEWGGKREPQKIPPFRIVEFFGGVVRGMTTRQRLPHLSEALWRDAETPGNSATPVPGPQ